MVAYAARQYATCVVFYKTPFAGDKALMFETIQRAVERALLNRLSFEIC
jgi:hypothetical protein